MKARKIAFTLVLCLAGVAACYASDPVMGTWKLNEAKSEFPPGRTKTTTVVYAAVGDQVKVTTEGTEADGKAFRDEWVGKLDGKDYPFTGDPSRTRAYKQIGHRTLELTSKKDGKIVSTGRAVVSADGKTRTVDIKGTTSDGKKISYIAVYDKQ